jgi:hypothetical protein
VSMAASSDAVGSNDKGISWTTSINQPINSKTAISKVLVGGKFSLDEGYDSLPSTRRSTMPYDDIYHIPSRGSMIQSPNVDNGKAVGSVVAAASSNASSPHNMLLASNLISCPELFDMTWPWMDTLQSIRKENAVAAVQAEPRWNPDKKELQISNNPYDLQLNQHQHHPT